MKYLQQCNNIACNYKMLPAKLYNNAEVVLNIPAYTVGSDYSYTADIFNAGLNYTLSFETVVSNLSYDLSGNDKIFIGFYKDFTSVIPDYYEQAVFNYSSPNWYVGFGDGYYSWKRQIPNIITGDKLKIEITPIFRTIGCEFRWYINDVLVYKTEDIIFQPGISFNAGVSIHRMSNLSSTDLSIGLSYYNVQQISCMNQMCFAW